MGIPVWREGRIPDRSPPVNGGFAGVRPTSVVLISEESVVAGAAAGYERCHPAVAASPELAIRNKDFLRRTATENIYPAAYKEKACPAPFF